MVSCLGDVHIWSVKNQAVINDDDTGCFTYHDKHDVASAEHPYREEKIQYTEGRNVTWSPTNKRPDKLKDVLRDVEDLLATYRCIRSKWVSRRLLQLILSNGIVISMVISIHTGDVDKIFVDRSLVGKLSSENTSDAVLTDAYLAVTYMDKNRIDYFCFSRRPSADKKIEKISAYDPRLVQVDLPGPVGRRLNRRLVCNLHQDVIVCWWPITAGEAQPWSPMVTDQERANIIVLAAIGLKFEILSYNKTDCNPIGVQFSIIQPTQLLSVEEWIGPGGEINVNSCIYACSRSKIHKISQTTVPVPSTVTSYDRNLTEDKLLLGCEDGNLIIYDEYKKLSDTTKANLVPCMVRWHPSGTVVMVSNTRGDLQLFDLALNPLNYQLVAENPKATPVLQIAQYLRFPSMFSVMNWSPLVDQPENKMAECNDALFLTFEKGPMVLIQLYLGVLSNGVLSPLSLVHQYIKYCQMEPAISVLSALNWNSEGQTCYACLSAIFNHLLKLPLNFENEALLEAALGTFYAPAKSLTEATILEYRDPISRFARRFFHHLLRYSRFEKAFLLAVDIDSRDLFMDIHYLARDRGEMALADAARNKATEIELPTVHDEELYSGSESGDDYEETHPKYPAGSAFLPHHKSNPQHKDARRRQQYEMAAADMQMIQHHNPNDPGFFRPHLKPTYVPITEHHLVKDLEAELEDEVIDEELCNMMRQTSANGEGAQSEHKTSRSNVTVINFGLV